MRARTARLFFALWPDDVLRLALYRHGRALHESCGGRLIPRTNLHQTLVFLGNVAPERISLLLQAASRVRIAAFRFELGVTGYWRHNRIVWAAPVTLPPPLLDLVSALENELRGAGFAIERRAYAPHVTLIRDARAPETLPPLPLAWPVQEFVLAESVSGGRGPAYHVRARWPLQAAPK